MIFLNSVLLFVHGFFVEEFYFSESSARNSRWAIYVFTFVTNMTLFTNITRHVSFYVSILVVALFNQILSLSHHDSFYLYL